MTSYHISFTVNTNKLLKKLKPDFFIILHELNWFITVLDTFLEACLGMLIKFHCLKTVFCFCCLKKYNFCKNVALVGQGLLQCYVA